MYEIISFRPHFFQAMDVAFNHTAIQKLIKTRPHYDVALVTSMSFLGPYIVKKVLTDTPMVTVFPALRSPITDAAMGNPTNPAYLPIVVLNYGQRMSFSERVVNTLATLVFIIEHECLESGSFKYAYHYDL